MGAGSGKTTAPNDDGLKARPMVRSSSPLVAVIAASLLVSSCGTRSAPDVPDASRAHAAPAAAETVTFPSGALTLHGSLYRPRGAGPFPAVLYNHGSASGMASVQAADALGPVFAARGYLFFMPYRRGQGLSADAGPYLLDQVETAKKAGGERAGAAEAVRLLEHEHLDDQLAALAWLKARSDVAPEQVAVMGTSFGGIETVLGAEKGTYCAAVDASGAAMSWAEAPEIQESMKRAVRSSRVPVMFVQAENDFDLTPSRALAAEMVAAGKRAEVKIYPAFGATKQEGHTLGYFGAAVWGEDVFRFLGESCGRRPGRSEDARARSQ
jgi:carboxymethylenebutenolidase